MQTKRVSLETCRGSEVNDNAYHNSRPKLSLNYDHSGQNAFYAVVEWGLKRLVVVG